MKTKKIIADSMPLALKMVRQELGENAIIVNTRTIKTGGMFGMFSKQKFEVTAYSIDKDGDTPAPQFSVELKERPPFPAPGAQNSLITDEVDKNSGFHKQPQKLYGYYSQTNSQKETDIQNRGSQATSPLGTAPQAKAAQRNMPQANATQTNATHAKVSQTNATQANAIQAKASQTNATQAKGPQAASPQSERDDSLLDELQGLRKMMLSFMMNDQQKNALPEAVVKWVDRLKAEGVEEEVVLHFVNKLLKNDETLLDLREEDIKRKIHSMIVEIIEQRIPTPYNGNGETRVINMIGPTGVGKTTTIAKLATEQILKQKRRVAMVTTDVYRIAAVEQLKTYAGILNVPIEVVRSSEELSGVLEKLKHYDLTYMDTTGRNYKERAHRESIAEFLNHPYDSENYLVLSLTTKFEDIKMLLDEFLDSPIQKLILTKFDETSSYGSILNIAYMYPYEIAYITNGQSVPEDIMTIDAPMLASHLLGEEDEDGSSAKPSRIHASI